jgi:hypothetical protein
MASVDETAQPAGSLRCFNNHARAIALVTQSAIPDAVQIAAPEASSARIRAFCDGSTLSPPTAPNVLITPKMATSGPSRPEPATTGARDCTLAGNSFLRTHTSRDHRTVTTAPASPTTTSTSGHTFMAALWQTWRLSLVPLSVLGASPTVN